jgi:hypothetical protein
MISLEVTTDGAQGGRQMAARNGHSSGGSSHFTWEASEWPTFLHLDIFDDEWSDLGLGDDDLQELQSAILALSESYPIIRGTEGLRKTRFAPSREARGKSGAYRVGYVRFPEFGFILLVTFWGKNDKADLSPRDRNAIAAMVRDIRRTLGARRDR